MNNYLVCTPMRRVTDYDTAELRDVRPNETTWLNMDQVAYAVTEQWVVKHPGEEDVTWEIVQIVMVDGTHFNVLASDWKRWLA